MPSSIIKRYPDEREDFMKYVFPGAAQQVNLGDGIVSRLIVVLCDLTDRQTDAYICDPVQDYDQPYDQAADTDITFHGDHLATLLHRKERTIELPDIGIMSDEFVIVLNHFASMTTQ